MSTDNSIQQLTETVNTLTVALANSEKRYQSIENILRWAGVIFLSFALVFFYVAADLVATAHATTEPQEVLKVLSADIKELSANIKEAVGEFKNTLSEVKSTLKDASLLIHNMKAGTDMLVGVSRQLSPLIAAELQTELAGEKSRKPTDVESLLAKSIAALPILVNRIKADSDAIRRQMEGNSGLVTAPAFQDIQKELHLINGALLSVPVMAAEMRDMNYYMMIMAHDTDSTMGRAGRLMPWW